MRPFPCAYVMWKNYPNRPEFCPNDVDTPFSDTYCGDHLPDGPVSPEDYEGEYE